MAIWQYDFSLLPELGLIRAYGRMPDTMEEYFIGEGDDIEDTSTPNYWQDVDCRNNVIAEVEKFLREDKSWSEDACFFGSENGDKIEVWSDGEINCRFDMRNPDLEVLESMLRLARKYQLVLVSNDSAKIIKPVMSAVAADIESSAAMKFCQDPQGYLRSLGEHG